MQVVKAGYILRDKTVVKKPKKVFSDGDSLDFRMLLHTLTRKYTDTLRLDSTMPYEMENRLHVRLDNYAVSLSTGLADVCDNGVDEELPPEQIIERLQAPLQDNVTRLTGIMDSYNIAAEKLNLLLEQQALGYRFFLYVADIIETTCAACSSRDGEIFMDTDLYDGVNMPPLHPNCRCSLVAMDIAALQQYNNDSRSFMQRLREVIDFHGYNASGIYTLEHSFMYYGIAPDTLTPIKLPTVVRPQVSGNWMAEFRKNAAEFFQTIHEGFVERFENRFDSLPSYLNFLSIGILDAVAQGYEDRAAAMFADPSLYNIVNWVSSGILDLLAGTFAPEEPLSLEHWLDSLGTVALFYFSYRLIQRNIAIRADIRAIESASSSVTTIEFEGKTITQDNDLFDPYAVDETGRTNIQLMQKGRAPIGYDGKPVDIHHITQTNNSPLLEMPRSTHQQLYSSLHQNTGQLPSLINRGEFNTWRNRYWKWRASNYK